MMMETFCDFFDDDEIIVRSGSAERIWTGPGRTVPDVQRAGMQEWGYGEDERSALPSCRWICGRHGTISCTIKYFFCFRSKLALQAPPCQNQKLPSESMPPRALLVSKRTHCHVAGLVPAAVRGLQWNLLKCDRSLGAENRRLTSAFWSPIY